MTGPRPRRQPATPHPKRTPGQYLPLGVDTSSVLHSLPDIELLERIAAVLRLPDLNTGKRER